MPADIIAACGCTEQADIPGDDLIAWPEADQKRVVYNASDLRCTFAVIVRRVRRLVSLEHWPVPKREGHRAR